MPIMRSLSTYIPCACIYTEYINFFHYYCFLCTLLLFENYFHSSRDNNMNIVIYYIITSNRL